MVYLTVCKSEEHRNASSGSRGKDRGNAARSIRNKFRNTSKDHGHVAETLCLSVANTATHGNRHTNDQIVIYCVISIRGETGGLARIAYVCSVLSKCMVVH